MSIISLKAIILSMKTNFIVDEVKKVGSEVELFGWAETVRDHKKVIFIDLRDRSGVVQLVGNESLRGISCEDVLYIKGLVKKRPDHMINQKIPTGEVEVEVKEFKILSKSEGLPIPIDTDGYEIDEEIRLQYRYLDLRRKRMLSNLIIRHKAIKFIRDFLNERDFLMVAGIERYFQIARCFRDEDPRADRAYGEFTQLDLEMSFVTQEDILVLTEELFTKLVKEIFPNKKMTKSPWPRLSHSQAQEKYQSDKPDLRQDKKDKDELAFVWVIDYPLFTEQSESDYFHGSGKAKYAPSHNMFTAPHPDDIGLLDTSPEKVRGLQHDLVLNGFEVGGGSIRIHDSKIQEKIFELIGFSDAQKGQFNHMLTAFKYGVPPHGGIAPGIDRFLMSVLSESSVRELIPFPASSGGKTAVMQAPSLASPNQLDELGIKIVK